MFNSEFVCVLHVDKLVGRNFKQLCDPVSPVNISVTKSENIWCFAQIHTHSLNIISTCLFIFCTFYCILINMHNLSCQNGCLIVCTNANTFWEIIYTTFVADMMHGLVCNEFHWKRFYFFFIFLSFHYADDVKSIGSKWGSRQQSKLKKYFLNCDVVRCFTQCLFYVRNVLKTQRND